MKQEQDDVKKIKVQQICYLLRAHFLEDDHFPSVCFHGEEAKKLPGAFFVFFCFVF